MPNFKSLLKWARYLPGLIEVGRNLRPAKQEQQKVEKVEGSLSELKKALNNRMDALEAENTRLRNRVKELETEFIGFKALFYIGGGVLILVFIILLITVLIHVNQ